MEPIEDPVEIRRRIDRMLKRIARRDDYGQLLATGDVVRRIENVIDPYLWGEDIRRKARADRIRVRTSETAKTVWAMRLNVDGEDARREGEDYWALLQLLVPMTIAMRHEPNVVARDVDESVFCCDRCSALGYADSAAGILGGDLLDQPCPHDEEPRVTSLAWGFSPRPSGS